MDCAFCKRTMEGCASIKCSTCESHFHLECVGSEQLFPGTNSWQCCKCAAGAALGVPNLDTVVSA